MMTRPNMAMCWGRGGRVTLGCQTCRTVAEKVPPTPSQNMSTWAGLSYTDFYSLIGRRRSSGVLSDYRSPGLGGTAAPGRWMPRCGEPINRGARSR